MGLAYYRGLYSFQWPHWAAFYWYPLDHCFSVATNGWTRIHASGSINFRRLPCANLWGDSHCGPAQLVEWNSGSSGIIRVRGRKSIDLVVGRTVGHKMFACLPFGLSTVRVNGLQSLVTSAVTGSMPLGHRCTELVGGLIVVRRLVSSAFWSPGAAGMTQTRRCLLAAASQPPTGITAGSCLAVPVRVIGSARSFTSTPSAELALVLRPKIVVPLCWHWRFASTLCVKSLI